MDMLRLMCSWRASVFIVSIWMSQAMLLFIKMIGKILPQVSYLLNVFFLGHLLLSVRAFYLLQEKTQWTNILYLLIDIYNMKSILPSLINSGWGCNLSVPVLEYFQVEWWLLHLEEWTMGYVQIHWYECCLLTIGTGKIVSMVVFNQVTAFLVKEIGYLIFAVLTE